MRYFDDYKNKKRDFTRIELKFSNTIDKILSVWEIENLLKDFSSLYYKADLIHTLCGLFNSEIDLKNVLISNNDIDFKDFPNSQRIKFHKEINFLYKAQLTTPCYENPNHKSTEIIFELFRLVNRNLDKNGIPPLYIRQLPKFIDAQQKDGLKAALTKIKSFALKRASESEILSAYMSSICDNFIKNALIEFDLVIKRSKFNFENNDINLNKFFDSFNSLNNPIIAIYNPKLKEYHIIGFDHFKSTNHIHTFEIVSISHASPTLFVIDLSPELIWSLFGSLAAILVALKDYYKSQRDKKEVELIEDKTQSDVIYKNQLNELRTTINRCSLFESKYKKAIIDGLDRVENKRLRGRLKESLDIIAKNYEFFIKDHNISILDIEELE